LTPAAVGRAAVRLARAGTLAVQTLSRAARVEGEGPAALRARSVVLSVAARRALSAHGLDVLRRGEPPDGSALLVCNHRSYLDALVVAAMVPCTPVSKAEVASWPVFGAVARRTGVLFVARDSATSRRKVMSEAEAALAGGVPILNFPEGTTSDGVGVLPFRRGLFGVAQRLGILVVPLAIAYDPPSLAWVGDATFLPHYLRFAAMDRAAVTVSFGAPLPPRAYSGPQELADAARERVHDLLEGPLEWFRKTH